MRFGSFSCKSMDRATLLTLLQGLGITLQMVNAQLAVLTHNTSEALLIGAVIGGYQYVIQHLGNATPVPPSPAKLVIAPQDKVDPK